MATPTRQVNENYHIVGFTDSVTECDCCGKSGLKGTFCVSLYGEEKYFGSTCVTIEHGVTKEQKDLALKKYKGLKIYKIYVYLSSHDSDETRRLDNSRYSTPDCKHQYTLEFTNKYEMLSKFEILKIGNDGYKVSYSTAGFKDDGKQLPRPYKNTWGHYNPDTNLFFFWNYEK